VKLKQSATETTNLLREVCVEKMAELLRAAPQNDFRGCVESSKAIYSGVWPSLEIPRRGGGRGDAARQPPNHSQREIKKFTVSALW
jgi:hypothetical protein